MLLFYRRGGLGDTLLTFPVLENLKRMGKEILAVGNTDYLKIAKEVGWVDHIAGEPPPKWEGEKLIISFEGDIEPFPKRREWIVEYYLRSLGLPLSFSKRLPLKPMPYSPFEGRVVLHPSSGSFKKNPSLELFHRIEHHLKKRGLEVVYFLGPADEWLRGLVKPYWESYDPLELARAFLSARLFIGLDSGVSHLASYCGVRSYVIFGPSDPVVFRPIGEKVRLISLNLSCSPCFPHVCQERACLDTEKIYELLFGIILLPPQRDRVNPARPEREQR